MTHNATIGERIGAPKHGYIPLNKRGKRSEYDGEGKRQSILDHIKAHNGEVIDQREMAEMLSMTRPTLLNHLRILRDRGKITIERSGTRRRYHIGRVPIRESGPVHVKQPAKPVTRTGMRVIQREAFAYLRGIDNPSAEVDGVLGFLKHLEKNSPKEEKEDDTTTEI